MLEDHLLSKAMIEHKTGDLDAAERFYRQILDINPSDPDALNLMGVLHLQHEKYQEAEHYLRKALHIDPSVPEYQKNLAVVLERKNVKNFSVESNFFDPATLTNRDFEKTRLKDKEICHTHYSPPVSNFFPMTRKKVIQDILNRAKGKRYLEIGVANGETFFDIDTQTKIGVDPNPGRSVFDVLMHDTSSMKCLSYETNNNEALIKIKCEKSNSLIADKPPSGDFSKCSIYRMGSDEFFSHYADKLFSQNLLDLAFIDGLHTYEQSYKDFLNSITHLKDNGVIILHDCNPPTSASAFPANSWKAASDMNLPGWNGAWCGDVWKTIVHLRSKRNDLSVFVLNCDFGIGVVRKGEPENMLDFETHQIESMDYDILSKNRERLLNLKEPEYLYQFIDSL